MAEPMQFNATPVRNFGDDFFEIDATPQPAQLDALKLFQSIGLKTPFIFGGSVRDVVHGLPFKDIDVKGCYRDIHEGSIMDAAREIEARLAAQPDVSDITSRIKFNFHTGGQHIVLHCKHKGVDVDATLEAVQLSIHNAQKRENVTLSGAYITHDGRIIAHQSFLDAVTHKRFNIVKYRSTKQFLIALERFVRLRKRSEYSPYKLRIDLLACFQNRGSIKPEPWPSLKGIFKHAKRLVERTKLHEPTVPTNNKEKQAKPDEAKL